MRPILKLTVPELRNEIKCGHQFFISNGFLDLCFKVPLRYFLQSPCIICFNPPVINIVTPLWFFLVPGRRGGMGKIGSGKMSEQNWIWEGRGGKIGSGTGGGQD